jgi:hypothetical protein
MRKIRVDLVKVLVGDQGSSILFLEDDGCLILWWSFLPLSSNFA